MKHKFLSLVAATCMVGFMAISASAGGLTQVSNGALANISAKGYALSNTSSVYLNNSQNSAYGIIIADLSSSAVNNQSNWSSYAKYFAKQSNSGTAINKVKSEGPVYQNSGVSLGNSESYASGLMIVNASSSAANNQLNVASNTGGLAQSNSGTAINIISGEISGSNCGGGDCSEHNRSLSTPTTNTGSGVSLTGSENGTAGLMIANMSSTAANNQLNVNYGSSGYFTPQVNSGLAVNVIAAH